MTVEALRESIQGRLAGMTPQDKADLIAELPSTLWVPQAGPQTEAMESKADVIFYGGAAGGGKTDLAIGKAITVHQTSIIFRRIGKQLSGITQRVQEILGTRDGYNSQKEIWNIPGGSRRLEFGSCKDLGDEEDYRGRPHSLKVFDEVTQFLEYQFQFLCGWMRTTVEGEPQQILCTGNPPTSAEGDWVRVYWGAWLDPGHPNPALPGELRWYAMLNGVDTPVPDGSIVENDNDADPGAFEQHYLAIVQSEQVQIYETVLQDTENRVSTNLLRAARYLKDNRLLPSGFEKAAQYEDIAVRGGAREDDDFQGGGDEIQYIVNVGSTEGPFTVTVELLYQSIGYRWAENLRKYDAPEIDRFMGYYDAVPNQPVVVSHSTVEVGG